MKRFLALLMAACMAAACAAAEETPAQLPATITAQGCAEVEKKEHYTLLTLGLQAEAETVALAHAQLEAMRTTLLQVLSQMDIEETALHYTYYDVESVYDYHNTKLSETKLLRGFTATIEMEITLNDSKRAGELVDALHKAGLDFSSVFSFESEALPGAYEAALAAASQDAMNTAQQLAQAFGVTLGDLLSVQENSADGVVEVQTVYAAK